jgi:4-amino-4-deoxy-L-arabinose transferase-like glycosyltransferase
LLGLALYLPGIRSLPVTDRDEARYAQASKQMVESGDYLRIRFLNEARNKKPAGIYWLQSACVRLTGVKDAIWPYRLVSVAGALIAVLLIGLFAQRLANTLVVRQDAGSVEWMGLDSGTFSATEAQRRRENALPAFVLCASPLLVCVSHAAITDTMVLATVCLAQSCLASIYFASRIRDESAPVGRIAVALGFWIAVGVGILVKGPITPMIAGLTILALCLHDRETHWLRGLHPALGFPLLLLLVLPWLLAIQHATGGAFLRESVGHDFLAKAQGGQEQHGALPGTYLATASLLFWPLFPLAWRGLGRAWQARRTDASTAFLLAWLVPSWLLFELVPTKLPHYVLPLYPALVFLAMRRQEGEGRSDDPARSLRSRIWDLACRLVDAGWLVGALVFIAGPVLAARLFGHAWMPASFFCAAAAAAAAVLIWRFRRNPGASAAVSIGFALLYFPVLFTCILPRLDELWLTRSVAALVSQETGGRDATVISVGYTEPSVAFTFGTQTILDADPARAIRELHRPGTLALVQDAPVPLPKLLPVGDAAWARINQAFSALPKHCHRQAFLDAAARAGMRVREVGSVDGWNYSRTKRMRVILYAREKEAVVMQNSRTAEFRTAELRGKRRSDALGHNLPLVGPGNIWNS